MKTKSSRFDRLVARYYPAVYSFAVRLTDDPCEAIALTRDAFNRQQLPLAGKSNRITELIHRDTGPWYQQRLFGPRTFGNTLC